VHAIDGCWVADKNMPEAAVAYDERALRQLYEKFGFRTETSVFYGAWCGRDSFVDYQDMIVAKREEYVSGVVVECPSTNTNVEPAATGSSS
jgi:hypothetical protein